MTIIEATRESAQAAGGDVTTVGTLTAGSYTVTGTDGDVVGNAGTWSYTLTVTPGTITQDSPTADTVDVAGSPSYFTSLVTTGDDGNGVIFSEDSSADSGDIEVERDGDVDGSGFLAPGSYTVTGTDHDRSGNTGTWTFTLTVTVGPITGI